MTMMNERENERGYNVTNQTDYVTQTDAKEKS